MNNLSTLKQYETKEFEFCFCQYLKNNISDFRLIPDDRSSYIQKSICQFPFEYKDHSHVENLIRLLGKGPNLHKQIMTDKLYYLWIFRHRPSPGIKDTICWKAFNILHRILLWIHSNVKFLCCVSEFYRAYENIRFWNFSFQDVDLNVGCIWTIIMWKFAEHVGLAVYVGYWWCRLLVDSIVGIKYRNRYLPPPSAISRCFCRTFENIYLLFGNNLLGL